MDDPRTLARTPGQRQRQHQPRRGHRGQRDEGPEIAAGDVKDPPGQDRPDGAPHRSAEQHHPEDRAVRPHAEILGNRRRDDREQTAMRKAIDRASGRRVLSEIFSVNCIYPGKIIHVLNKNAAFQNFVKISTWDTF